MNLIIDGLKFNSKEQFHWYIKELLKLPDYYGENLDALWDCLTSWVDLPLRIIWINYTASKNSLGDYAEKILETFKEAEVELDYKFKIDIQE